MNQRTNKNQIRGKGLHPRNLHRDRYNFPALISTSPGLKPFVSENRFGDLSIDFANPDAVKMLNRALLHHFYQIDYWDIPSGYLVPPIPGRADYIHYIADLLSESNNGIIPKGKKITGLDIGTGASCIYPIIGVCTYKWNFTAIDIDPVSIKVAKLIVETNAKISGKIKFRLQRSPQNIFKNILKPNDRFDFTICNPPFHESPEAATFSAGTKLKNLAGKKVNKTNRDKKTTLNFGGQNRELWCPGGELAFIKTMIAESSENPLNCFWYSTLVSKKENLPIIHTTLRNVKAFDIRTINMTQGNKISRIVAWTFLTKEQQTAWRKNRL